MTPMDWAWLVVLSILWGGSFIFIEVTLVGLPPLTLVMLRLAIAAAVLAAGLAVLGRLPPATLRVWGMFGIMGLLNNAIPFTLFAWGQTQIGAGLAAILNATTPLFTLVIAHIATDDDKITHVRIAALAIGFGGVVALLGGEALAGTPALTASLACLAAAVSYAVSGVHARRVSAHGISPAQASLGQLTCAFILVAPLALAAERPWTLAPPSMTVWAALLALALVSTVLAYIIFFHVLARAGATNVLLVTFLQPVSAVAMGIAFRDEQLTAAQAAGMILILVGLGVIDGRLVARLGWSKLRP